MWGWCTVFETGFFKPAANNPNMEKIRITFRAMACDNIIELYALSATLADEAIASAVREVKRIEAKYSRYHEDSVVSRINRASGKSPVDIDAETAQLLAFADVCHQQSGGLFDITAGILRRAWNFKAAQPPSREFISPLLPLIGWQLVVRSAGQVYLSRPGMEIDFGGFGKEYAADRAAAVLLSYGLPHAFVSLGGDIVVTGPHANGEPWHLGIRHPRKEGTVIATLPITSGAVATSGDYERFIEFEGRRYSHILDPRTGESVEGFQSVTAFAPTCLVAGSITTIAMLKGKRMARQWLDASGSQYLAVDAAARVFSNQCFTATTCRPAN